jgi:hypothetical protein
LISDGVGRSSSWIMRTFNSWDVGTIGHRTHKIRRLLGTALHNVASHHQGYWSKGLVCPRRILVLLDTPNNILSRTVLK